ncbi:DUF3343 domain-containing protein [Atopobacter sp. AH10]|uniref:DUF3343 domain-containing protein n=1 Tax=Atopobacter sp. AH10 TaxID=2315861 RepID=UPI000EF201F3|nr:DUF3343 domain-containing protein [Atopobacter sp. AH10]RLK62782.1 DUF3343 domain-containing protein [Atopobacter sp. AH10]
MGEKYLYLTFSTTADAIACEKTCKAHGIKGRLVAAPRQMSAGCGLAFRSGLEEREALEGILASQAINIEKIQEI